MTKVLIEKGADVEAYDLFPDNFEINGINCQIADLTKALPIPDSYADYVLCQEGIEHIPDQLHMLREFNRILKQDGKLIITTPNISHLRARISHLLLESDLYNRFPASEIDAIWLNAKSDEDYYFGHIFLIGIQKLRTLATIAGFEINKVLPVKASISSLAFSVFLPIIWFASIYTYFSSLRRYKKINITWKSDVFKQMLRFNFNPNILFGKHLFIEMIKQNEIQNIRNKFYIKLSS